MSRMLWVLLLAACRPSQGEVEDLRRRVDSLENRVRQLEGGARVRTVGKPRKPAATGTITVTGDAKRVYLVGKTARIPMPGTAPVGDYTLIASFEGDAAPQDFGHVSILAKHLHTVSCEQAQLTCEMATPVPE